MVENIPARGEFSLIDDENMLAKDVPTSQLHLGTESIKKYNKRYRFFQNFEDNNIPHNEILETTGQNDTFFSNLSLAEKMMRDFPLIEFKSRKLPVSMLFAQKNSNRHRV